VLLPSSFFCWKQTNVIWTGPMQRSFVLDRTSRRFIEGMNPWRFTSFFCWKQTNVIWTGPIQRSFVLDRTSRRFVEGMNPWRFTILLMKISTLSFLT
jgi:hypothetical protein